MARKPTRFWHPARRLLLEAQEKARALVGRPNATSALDDVRPRLQHYLKAMYGHAVMIESVAPPKNIGWPKRALRQLALVKERGISESTAECIRLPATLPAQHASVSVLEQYRVIAVQHAERMRRATARHAHDVSTDLERDLYQLAEAATVDAQILATQPGLRTVLDAARLASMAERPKPRWRTDIELRVEDMFRRAWPTAGGNAQNPSDIPAIPLDNDAQSNATWARRTAVALESKYGRKAAREYRRVPEITLWQTTINTPPPEQQQFALETERRPIGGNSAPELKAQQAPGRSSMPGAAQSGPTPNRSAGRPENSAPDRDGSGAESNSGDDENRNDSGKTTDDGDGDSGNTSTSTSNDSNTQDATNNPQSATDATGARTPAGAGGEGSTLAVAHSTQVVDDANLTGGITYRYPEWDFHTQAFHPSGTVVRIMPPPAGATDWGRSALIEHTREVQNAKRHFERLRSHRLRLRRQVQGDELDLEACVEAIVDRRMGVAPNDRLYSHVRPGRRELAITLLIDVSGSTSEVVAGHQRVIDIERIAALVATAAFDALGDDYSILAFSSSSASNVRVHTLKEFGEKNSSQVLERIGALAPRGTTRLGAAIRHATAMLGNHRAPHRLLLIISDGKPYDYDWYWTEYAIQDSRHAVMSARLQGIHPFCITVDTDDDEAYLPDVFGTSGYRVVTRPSQLAQALLLAVQRMIGEKG